MAIFSISSALAVLAFLFFTRALHAFGNISLILALALIDIIFLLIIGITDHQETMMVAFVLFLVVNPLIFLGIDVFFESLIGGDESSTGSKRGLALSLMSIASVLAPLTMSSIVEYSGGTDMSNVYFAAALIFVPFIVIILARFRNFKDPHYQHGRVNRTLYDIWHLCDVRNVLLSHFSFQLFLVWMTIYIPLYLLTEIRFSWDTIGSIIAVGFLAYVICEWPIGILADK